VAPQGVQFGAKDIAPVQAGVSDSPALDMRGLVGGEFIPEPVKMQPKEPWEMQGVDAFGRRNEAGRNMPGVPRPKQPRRGYDPMTGQMR